MNYKKIFRSKSARRKVLSLLRFIPDKPMLKLQYRIKCGRKLDLKNPRRFTEKLQWYKLYYRNPVMHQCANKYAVREYVQKKGLGETLVPLYAHYDRAEDVDWESLPDRFVIKTQHGGGGLSVMTVPDKSKVTKDEMVTKLGFKKDKVGTRGGGREWAYWGNPTGIVVEELLINRENPEAGINDYKFYCFSGKPKYIHVDIDRYNDHRRNFYDTNWNKIDLVSEYPNYDGIVLKPAHLQEMLEVAAVLSRDFPFVRVDLYHVDEKVYFGEMTFYPSSGYAPHDPDEWDYRFGEEFELKEY